MEIIIGLGLLSIIPAAIASGKNRNPLLWYLLSLFFFLPAFVSILMLPEGGRVKCPECLGWVNPAAKKCLHCGARISGSLLV